MRNIKKLLVVLIAAALSSIIISGAVPEKFQSIVPSVEAVEGIGAKIDASIWPGFHYGELAVFVFDAQSREGLLLHAKPIPSGFTVVDASLPFLAWGKAPGNDPMEEGTGPIGSQMAGWIKLDGIKSDSPPEITADLYAEAFSVFEAYRGFAQPELDPSVKIPILDADMNARIRAEDALIENMLNAPTSELPALTAALLKMRADRQASLSPALAKYEWESEVSGGLAYYAGYSARSKNDAAGARARLISLLDDSAKGGKEAYGKRLGASGCVMALVLDRALPKWKTDFEATDRASFKPMLDKIAAGAQPADTSFINMDALSKEEIEAVNRVKEARLAKIALVNKVDGLILVLKLKNVLADGNIKWSNRYVPKGITDVGNDSEVRENYYSLSGQGLLTFASSRPILIRRRDSITVGFAKDETPVIKLDGKALKLAKGEVRTGKLELRGVHLSLDVEDAKVAFADKVLTVTPLVASPAGLKE